MALDISSFLKALDIRGRSAATVCLAAVALYVMADREIFHLQDLPAWTRGVYVVVAIAALAISASKFWDWSDAQLSTRRKERAEKKALEDQRAEVIGFLESISDTEREILSYLVQKNQQSFVCSEESAVVATLVHKHLVVAAKDGPFDMDAWPHMVPNHVWQELQRRKDEFNTAGLQEAPPWHEEQERYVD